MKRTEQDYLDLLQETINFYSEDISRRAEDISGSCLYSTEDGRNCAVGRCMTKKAKESIGTALIPASDLPTRYTRINSIDPLMKPKYKGFQLWFWDKLQGIHDSDGNWIESGLTKQGKDRVENLKRIINYRVKNGI